MRTLVVASGFALCAVSTSALQEVGQVRSLPQQQESEPSADRAALKPQDDEERALAAFFASYVDSRPPLKAGDIVGIGPVEPGPPPPDSPPDFVQLKSAVCQTDAIVSGRGTISRVFFNTPETLLITTYIFEPDEWLRPLTPARQPPTLRVALAGGEAVIDGKTTKTLGPAQLTPDSPAVLWLRRVKGTSTYVLAPDIGVLRFEGTSVRTTFPTWIPIFRGSESRSNLLTAIANAAVLCER